MAATNSRGCTRGGLAARPLPPVQIGVPPNDQKAGTRDASGGEGRYLDSRDGDLVLVRVLLIGEHRFPRKPKRESERPLEPFIPLGQDVLNLPNYRLRDRLQDHAKHSRFLWTRRNWYVIYNRGFYNSVKLSL